MEREKVLYHIIRCDEWNKVKGDQIYAPDSLQAEGFIHCSTKEQVFGVADALFRGEKDLRILSINPELVEAEIVFEDLYGSGQEFPHIYGALKREAVMKVSQLELNEDGELKLG